MKSTEFYRSIIETHKHIKEVGKNLNIFVRELLGRAEVHDNTKFESPEVEIFGENTYKLAQYEYGSSQYNECLESIKPALTHHYSKNSHHPEYHKRGVDDMDLVDLLEMFADWAAATKRNKDGNLRKSIQLNAIRFNISPQLTSIFENTAKRYF